MSEDEKNLPDEIFQKKSQKEIDKNLQLQRLHGGMESKDVDDDKENIDDLNLEDAEDEEAPKEKKAAKVLRLQLPEPKTKEEAAPTAEFAPAPPLSRVRQVFHYIKITFLSLIWLLMVYWLGWMPIEKQDGRLTTIFPNQTKLIKVQLDLVKYNVLGMRTFGPFLVDGEAQTHSAGDRRHIMAFLEKTERETATAVTRRATVSNTQYILLSNEKNCEYARTFKVFANFALRNFTKNDDEKVELHLNLRTNIEHAVTMKFFFERSLDRIYGLVLGGCVLALLYISIVWELINRTFIAVIAATLAVAVLGFMRSWPSLGKIITWMDTETLLLLFGMMILVGILAESGIFEFFAVYAYKLSRGHIWPMVNMLCFFTACISPFVDSVTVMLLITPIVVRLCELMQADPRLVLMFLVIFANVSAASTPVGDPPNLIITTNSFIASHNVTFGVFMLHMMPCALLAVLQSYIQLRLTFRKLVSVPFKADAEEELRQEVHAWERAADAIQPYSKETTQLRKVLTQRAARMRHRISRIGKQRPPTANFEETLAELRSSHGIRNKWLLIKSAIAFAFSMSLFFLHSVHGLHQLTLGEAALIGAILILIIADVRDMEAVLGRVEWSTLIFFASLFVLMEALTEIGVIAVLGQMVEHIVFAVNQQNRLFATVELLLVVSAVASAFLDNIPVTTMMVRIVVGLSQNKELNLPLHPMVWALAMGTCFGGNGTLIGGSANVVAAGVAEQHGYTFTFKRFFIVGFPIMIGNVVIASIYLYVCHVAFKWHDPPIQ